MTSSLVIVSGTVRRDRAAHVVPGEGKKKSRSNSRRGLVCGPG